MSGPPTRRQKSAATDRKKSAEVREVGPLPPVTHPKLRKKAETDPEYFLLRYFPNRFYLGFGAPHRKAIQAIEDCITAGGLHAMAMMRGGGKTAITEPMILRALLYGRRRYAVFIGATDSLASQGVKRMKWELESNDQLLADFPEACFPIRKLDRVPQRIKGQTLDGLATNMELPDGHIVLPTVKGSKCSGSVVQAFGITGAIRGLQRLAPDGTPIRPDIVLLDDCQTRESATSPTQTERRERIILDEVMGLAGPTTKMAAVFLCTPVVENDLTERFINRELHPEWGGVRTQMVEAMPANMTLWDQYSEARRAGMREGDKGAAGNDFYQHRQVEMDTGCVLAWPDRMKTGDLSAVQTAMNLRIDNPVGFASEYQCQPLKPASAIGAKLNHPATISERLSGVAREQVPPDCTRLTAFVDVHGEILYYTVVGWTERFGGSVVDYGTFPKQNRTVFLQSDPRPSMSDVFAGQTDEQRVNSGLSVLVPQIMGRPYVRAGGGSEMRVERCLIDAGWKPSPVFGYCAASPFAPSLFPSKGVGRSETSAGVGRWKVRSDQGEKGGHHWRLTPSQVGRGRQVQYDPDAWKTFVHGALAVPIGNGTALTLFGTAATDHDLFVEHLAAEGSAIKPHRGEVFDKWSVLPDRVDNHWLDCVVGCAVAASVQGLLIPHTLTVAPTGPPVKPMKMSDRQKMKAELKRQGGHR